jgi:hypothetical protein
MHADPEESSALGRARREHAAAVERGDDAAAEILARAVAVLEAALAGTLIPGQRKAPER